MAARRTPGRTVGPGQSLVLLFLVALTLAPSLLGRAGFQLLEDAVAASIFPLHQHGVPGEAEYIAAHGEPAPFVHAHCHALPEDSPAQRTPAELSVAGALLAPFHCAAAMTLPPAPSGLVLAPPSPVLRPQGRVLRPVSPPPQGVSAAA